MRCRPTAFPKTSWRNYLFLVSQKKTFVFFGKIKIEIEYAKSKNDNPHSGASQDRKRILSAEDAYNVFKRISDEDCRIMGFVTAFARPDWMIVTVLPVSPPPVRPTVMMDATRTAQDDITHKLRDILQSNGQIKRMVNQEHR